MTMVPVEYRPAAKLALDPHVAPAWGWRDPGGGRASHVGAAPVYQATTVQACGLFPFMAGSESPKIGVPMGRNLIHGDLVCIDPLEWVRAGLVTNPGVFVLGQPGAGKSAITKRLTTGMAAFGKRILVLGDLKPEYSPLVHRLGGQVIRIGRGLDRINPLDAGPLGTALKTMTGPAADRLRLEVHGRRVSLLLALCTLVRGSDLSNAEEVILGEAINLTVAAKGEIDPTVPEVLATLESGSPAMRQAARTPTERDYFDAVRDLLFTLALLCSPTMAGIFDGPTSTPLDMDARAVSLDISAVSSSESKLVAATMLCTWAYGHAMVDAAEVLAEANLAPRRHFVAVMDELWRLEGAPSLVRHADAMTRLNRQRGMASIMVTHSMNDLAALSVNSERSKATGFVERSAMTILTALPRTELEMVSKIRQLSDREIDYVASWAATESWTPGSVHPARGKSMVKTGGRLGLLMETTLTADERRPYDTDARMRRTEFR